MKHKNSGGLEDDKSLMNLLTTVIFLPVIVIAGVFMFFIFGSFELFTTIWMLNPLPISTPYLVLGIIGLPLALVGIIYYLKK